MSTASVFRIKYLFQKYLDASCTTEEFNELFELMAKEENLPEIEGLLEKLWADTEMKPDADAEVVHQEVLYNKLLEIVKKEKNVYSFQKRSSKTIIRSVAATIALLICAGLYFLHTRPKPMPLSMLTTTAALLMLVGAGGLTSVGGARFAPSSSRLLKRRPRLPSLSFGLTEAVPL